ncbi:hypothetical protein GCM10010965_22170 [Caldalkalibacillus thermarum]|uniref:type VII toxin-antitoxin system MntA family adenylyltransferase antitoxin n=1 Tax=Caldalkalibacillus thermarum TaxID=296745 RepID=UPI0016639590|nr:nucleotidyltransferase domain-containing protein [Caldalkalibacillus thermarum]GGK28890.1 hypothetical protein GCM10010965_22170 [Caldalkalibacillus thermarum]
MLTTAQQQRIIDVLTTKLSPWVIYLFGSYAQGTERPDSDLDLAVAAESVVEPYTLFMTGQEIASLIDKEVDLVNLKAASTVFQVQIISTGQVIYCTNENRRLQYEATILKMYARLNEERKAILDGIKERGSIYDT